MITSPSSRSPTRTSELLSPPIDITMVSSTATTRRAGKAGAAAVLPIGGPDRANRDTCGRCRKARARRAPVDRPLPFRARQSKRKRRSVRTISTAPSTTRCGACVAVLIRYMKPLSRLGFSWFYPDGDKFRLKIVLSGVPYRKRISIVRPGIRSCPEFVVAQQTLVESYL